MARNISDESRGRQRPTCVPSVGGGNVAGQLYIVTMPEWKDSHLNSIPLSSHITPVVVPMSIVHPLRD
jgi:hypothetical protein